MVLKSLDQIIDKVQKEKSKKLVVAAAEELHVLESIQMATNKNIISPILIGRIDKIRTIASSIRFDLSKCELVEANNPEDASRKAVHMIKNKEADILMKGLVTTSILLKAVVDHKNGITMGTLLSHIALCQINSYHKLIAITDAAMNIKPDFKEKIQIINNAVNFLNKLGYEKPKVAVVCPVEIENIKIESTIDASKLKAMNLSGEIMDCTIDGPLALDNIISKNAAIIKGITGEVAGDADIILTPDLDSGNILYKSIIFLAKGVVAAIITGASAPIVLTSRADTMDSKLYSIALAACI
jgi:phosphate butyryltransferase